METTLSKCRLKNTFVALVPLKNAVYEQTLNLSIKPAERFRICNILQLSNICVHISAANIWTKLKISLMEKVGKYTVARYQCTVLRWQTEH
jgi:hypothetical protein